MTTNTNINNWRKVLKLSAIFFIPIAFANCKKESTNIGDNLENGTLNVKTIDTFTVVTYSELVDSVETDESAVNLLGAYHDPDFGLVECGIVTELRLSTNNPVLKDSSTATMVVDSVVLSLKYTSINYYANLQPLTFEVFKVTDDLERDDKDYYTFTTPTTTGTSLVLSGSETVMPDIVSKQIVGTDELPAHLRIHLDPSLGDDFINASVNGDLASDNTFTSYFPGIYIKVDPSNLSVSAGSILYFVLENSISNVTMYFHNAADNVTKEYVFEFNSSGARYNSIQFDRTGTHVQQVLDNKLNGQESFYIQGSSIRAIIEFPHILDLNYDSLGNEDPKIINKAVLVLPVQDFPSDVFHPSKSLLIAKIIDSKLSELTLDVTSEGGLAGSLVTYNDTDKEFRFLLTREIAGMLNGTRDTQGFRIYSNSFFGSTIERIVFNGSNTTLKDKPRLEITYSEY